MPACNESDQQHGETEDDFLRRGVTGSRLLLIRLLHRGFLVKLRRQLFANSAA
jgi:hypothetical protein